MKLHVFTLLDILTGIKEKVVTDGDMFETQSGLHAIYKDGVLAWVTSGGYLASAISVTDENMSEVFNFIINNNNIKISFAEAVDLLAKGITVKIGQHELISLDDLEDVIYKHEYLKDMYEMECFVDGSHLEPTAEPDPEVDLPFIPNDLDVPYVAPKELAYQNELSQSGKKLTGSDAFSILHQYHFTKVSVIDLACRFEVSTRMIYYVIDGTHWTEVHEQFHKDYCVVKDDYIK